MSTRRINDLLNLAHVQHWHNVPTLRKPSVAEHSYRVAALTLEMCTALFITDTDTLDALRWAIMHDGPEAETGDLPGPIKKLLPAGLWTKLEGLLCPWFGKLNIRTVPYQIVRVADRMETLIFIMEAGRLAEAKAAEDHIRHELIAEISVLSRMIDMPKLDARLDRIIREFHLASDTRHRPFDRLIDGSLVNFVEHGANQQHSPTDQNPGGREHTVDTLPGSNAQYDPAHNPENKGKVHD